MIAARRRVVIRDELQPRLRSRADEGPRANGMLQRIRLIIGEIQPGQRDGQGAGVKQLEPVVFTGGRIRHPFVDPQRGGIAQRHGHVRRTARRCGQRPRIVWPRRGAAQREIGDLHAIDHAVEQRAADGRTVEEIHRAAVRAEFEAGVEGRRRFRIIELHDVVTASGNGRALRENPAARAAQIIREAEVGNVHEVGRGIEQLDPVRDFSVRVREGLVLGEDLVEHDGRAEEVGHEALRIEANRHRQVAARRTVLVNFNREVICALEQVGQRDGKAADDLGRAADHRRAAGVRHGHTRAKVVAEDFHAVQEEHAAIVEDV